MTQAPKAVDAGGKQICVEGLEHGEHYNITFRAGLPAAIGEVLEAPVDARASTSRIARLRPASPATASCCRRPRATAFRSFPSISTCADMKLYRIGDRSLAQLLSGYQFLTSARRLRRQLDRRPDGRARLGGQARHRQRPQQGSHDQLPDRRGAAGAQARRLCADRAAARTTSSDEWQSRATQWFVVSDIGLTTYTGAGRAQCLRPLAGDRQAARRRRPDAACQNNEMLGTAKTDDDGRATFTPGLTRGEGGMVPAVLMASEAQSDFVFLDMSRAGFDLSDRGVAGRPAPGALDVYAWTERGIYRVGEPCMSARLRATTRPRPSRTCRSPSSSRGRTASRIAASSATASRRRPCRRPRPRRQCHARHLAGRHLHRSQEGSRSPRRCSWSRTSCRTASSST